MILLRKTLLVILFQQIAFLCIALNAQTAYPEVAYVQTDRITYVAGESVLYKLYVLNAASKRPTNISKVGYIVIRDVASNPILKIRVKIVAGTSNGSIELPDTLSTGVYQIVAFTGSMKNFSEQNFFHGEISVLNRFDKELNFKSLDLSPKDTSGVSLVDNTLKITTNKPMYGLREKVIVSLPKTNANVAISVFEDSKLLSKNKSIVETINHQYSQAGNKKLGYYLPEDKGKILRGRVINVITHECVNAATVLLSCVDTIPNLQYAVTDSKGVFRLLLSDYYNTKELFLTIKNVPTNVTWKIELDDEFAVQEKWNPVLNMDNNNQQKDFFIKSQNIAYINKSYQLDSNLINRPILDRGICPQLYNCQVNTVFPSDFVSLDDFLEITVEILPLLKISKVDGKYRAQVFNTVTKTYYDASPAIFLDGVFVDDINKIIKLGSEQIKKVDIINTERIFGDLVFSGIVSIISKSNAEILASSPAINSIRYKNDRENGAGKRVLFNPYSNQNNNTPFVRQLLYWNPNLELNGVNETSFEFYTSDNLANYIIKVEGVTEDGLPISISSRIQVNN